MIEYMSLQGIRYFERVFDFLYSPYGFGPDRNRNLTMFDVGSHSGVDSCAYFLTMYPESTAYAFEADDRAYKKLLQTSSVFKDGKLKPFNIAISDNDFNTDFYMSDITEDTLQDEWDASGSTAKPTVHLDYYPYVSFKDKIKVKSKKLDTVVSEENVSYIDFLFVDVNGGEQQFMNGAKNTLQNKVNYLYIECAPVNTELYHGQFSQEQIQDELPQYEFLFRNGDNLLLRHK
jgi:FkbM family methyltransferase